MKKKVKGHKSEHQLDLLNSALVDNQVVGYFMVVYVRQTKSPVGYKSQTMCRDINREGLIYGVFYCSSGELLQSQKHQGMLNK